jgi:hypothetical protein
VPEDLYALPPEDFTAARDAAAKQVKANGDKAGAAALRALRRPTVPAHLVNLLVRAEPDLVDQLMELGRALAEAQAAGSGGALRELGEQRRALVGAVTSRAVELGSRAVTAAIRGEVESTLEAAMSDPASATAVRSGRLVRALSYAGFGDVDLEGAVAEPVDVPAPQAGDGAQQRIAAAERAVRDASGALDDAVAACEAAQRAQDRADGAAAEADEAVTRLEAELAAAREAQEQARQQRQEANQQVEQAGTAVHAAQDEAERTRELLDRLRRKR